MEKQVILSKVMKIPGPSLHLAAQLVIHASVL